MMDNVVELIAGGCFLIPGSVFTADQMIESLLNSAVRIDTTSGDGPFHKQTPDW
jgi:hypothetical protein